MWHMVLTLLFPPYCASCRRIGSSICISCRKLLRTAHTQQCIVCHRASVLGITHGNCRRKRGIDAAITILHYNTTLKRIIAQIKYHGYLEAYRELLWALQPQMHHAISAWRDAHLIDSHTVITAIPLHSARERARGFNQAQILAQTLSEVTGLTCAPLLTRTKNTPQLAKSPHDKTRSSIVQGAFTGSSSHTPQSVMVVDDVVTTGATVTEAAKILKKQGVQRVFVFSLARG